jgi:hypothetical protein
MMARPCVIGALFLAALPLAACRTIGADAHGQWHLCDIVSHPEAAEGQTVTFRAIVRSDGLEHTVLLDEACPKKGIVPSSFRAGAGDEVTSAIDAFPPGTRGKHVDALWTGVIQREGRMIELRVTDIRDVHVSKP